MAQKKARSKAGVRSKRAGRGASEIEGYQRALEGLERALRALYKGEVEKAKEQLERLKESHGNEADLMDRIRTFLAICENKLAPQRRPKSAEEFATYGVMLHNAGDTQQAIKAFSKALEMDPASPHIRYCLAAAHARTGDATEAAVHLRHAIQADPTSRIHALSDEDFDDVRDEGDVATLLDEA